MQSWILIVQPASSRQNICFSFRPLQSKFWIPLILIMGGNRLLMTWSREDWGGPWGPWGPWGEETERQAVAIGAHNVPHLDSTLTVRVTLTIYTKCAPHFDKVPQWGFHTCQMCHNMRAKCANGICPNWHTLRAHCATVPLYHCTTPCKTCHKKNRAVSDIKCITQGEQEWICHKIVLL